MVNYKCSICDYITIRKYDYNKHLKTKKHLEKHNNFCVESGETPNFPHKSSQILTNDNFSPHNNTQSHTIPHNPTQNPDNVQNLHKCKYCCRTFARIDSLNRHIEKYCKMNKVKEHEESLMLQIEEHKKETEEHKKETEEHKKEKDKLYDYIDKLIDKTGDTNITIDKQMNNQIKLNNFGEEDVSHISEDYMLKQLSLPYGMIQNMIERVHFNKKKPENKNIALTNKREKMIQVFRRRKWRFQDRFYVVDELIKNNYNRLDEYFEEIGKNKLNDVHNKRYLKFQAKFDRQDDELMDKIKRDTEMILLSENIKH
jgi:hypothetical protein